MRLKLIERKKEVEGVESFVFEPQEELLWKAGQFLHYALHHRPTDDRGSDRWFTVSSAPYEGKVVITTRHASERPSTFKTALFALNIGDIIEVADIDGDFTVEDLEAEYVFIAGGIGITPLHSILKELDHEGRKIKATLFYASRDENIIFKEELENFAENNPNLVIHHIIAPERIDESVIRKFVPDLTKPIFYVSGPEPMVESLNQMISSLGVDSPHIKGDFFPGYEAE